MVPLPHDLESNVPAIKLSLVSGESRATGTGFHHKFTAGAITELDKSPLIQAELRANTKLALGALLSLGAAGWAARGISLMASILAYSSAWGTFDLLPVLRRERDAADRGDRDLSDEECSDPSADDRDSATSTGKIGRSDEIVLDLLP
jgi:hypothetical protein